MQCLLGCGQAAASKSHRKLVVQHVWYWGLLDYIAVQQGIEGFIGSDEWAKSIFADDPPDSNAATTTWQHILCAVLRFKHSHWLACANKTVNTMTVYV